MKKTFFLSMILVIVSCSVINAQNEIPTDPPPPKPKGPTETPIVKASYTSDTLTVNITGYYGDVEVTVEEELSGIVQTTQTEYISWQGTVQTDIHSLSFGDYILRIRLDDDDEYVGYFSK